MKMTRQLVDTGTESEQAYLDRDGNIRITAEVAYNGKEGYVLITAEGEVEFYFGEIDSTDMVPYRDKIQLDFS